MSLPKWIPKIKAQCGIPDWKDVDRLCEALTIAVKALEKVKSQTGETDGVFGLVDVNHKTASEALRRIEALGNAQAPRIMDDLGER